jgi:hypothetical protein
MRSDSGSPRLGSKVIAFERPAREALAPWVASPSTMTVRRRSARCSTTSGSIRLAWSASRWAGTGRCRRPAGSPASTGSSAGRPCATGLSGCRPWCAGSGRHDAAAQAVDGLECARPRSTGADPKARRNQTLYVLDSNDPIDIVDLFLV